jgi:hypothetical protein
MAALTNSTLQTPVQLTRKDPEMRVGYLLSFLPGAGSPYPNIKRFDALSEWLAHLSEVSFGRSKGWREALVHWNCNGLRILVAGERKAAA